MAQGGWVRRGAALAVLAWAAGFGISTPALAAGDLCDGGVVFDGADVLDDRVVARAARTAFDDTVTVKVIAWAGPPAAAPLRRPRRRPPQCGGWGFSGGGRRSLLVLGVASAVASSAPTTTAGRSTASTTPGTTSR